jgi:hypothetical protein
MGRRTMNLRGRKGQKAEENSIMRNVTIFTLHQILSGRIRLAGKFTRMGKMTFFFHY